MFSVKLFYFFILLLNQTNIAKFSDRNLFDILFKIVRKEIDSIGMNKIVPIEA